MAFRVVLTAAVLAAGALALGACGQDQVRSSMPVGLGPSFGLFFNDQGPTVSLAYGEANSDDVALMLQCAKGSGKVDVSDVVRGAGAPHLTLASAGLTTELVTRLDTGESDAPRLLVARTDVGSGALQGFRHSGRIDVAYGAVRYGLKASDAERPAVARFFSACQKS